MLVLNETEDKDVDHFDTEVIGETDGTNKENVLILNGTKDKEVDHFSTEVFDEIEDTNEVNVLSIPNRQKENYFILNHIDS